MGTYSCSNIFNLNIGPSKIMYPMLTFDVSYCRFKFFILKLRNTFISKIYVSWTSNYRLDYGFMTDTSTVCKLDASSSVTLKSECDSHSGNDRSHIIMRNFARVLWNVLKEYNSKLKVMLFTSINY
jgi:hypothetical protein